MPGAVNPGSVDTVVVTEASRSNRSGCSKSSPVEVAQQEQACKVELGGVMRRIVKGLFKNTRPIRRSAPLRSTRPAGRVGERAAFGRHRCWASARFCVSRKAFKNRQTASAEATSCPSIDALRICQVPGSGGRNARNAERMEHRERKAYTQIGATAGWG